MYIKMSTNNGPFFKQSHIVELVNATKDSTFSPDITRAMKEPKRNT
jgi:hypothetical protein